MSRQRKLLPEEVQHIIDRVKRGEYLSQIHRETGFNTTIIKATAHRNGLVIQRLTDEQVAQRARDAKNKRKPPVPVRLSNVMTPEQYWYGLKCSLRW